MLLHTSARVEFHRPGRSCFYAPRGPPVRQQRGWRRPRRVL